MDACKSAISAFQFVVTMVKPILDHHTPDTINGFRDSILVCKMHDSYCTIHKNIEHFHFFSSSLFIKRCKRLQRLDYMKANHFKMLLNVFSTTYTYSNCNSISIILLLRKNLTNICSKLIKNL